MKIRPDLPWVAPSSRLLAAPYRSLAALSRSHAALYRSHAALSRSLAALSRSLAALLLAFVGLVPFAASAESAPDAAAELTRLLAGVQSFSATFEQFTEDARGQDVQHVQGRVWVERPNRFRWEGDAPLNQVIVSDGARTWHYDIDLAQVIVRRFDPAISKTPLMLLGGDPGAVRDAYSVRAETVEEERYFLLTPVGEDSLIEELELAFRGDELESIHMTDTLGQRTTIRFSANVRNQPIEASRFQFVVPEGADLIEDEQGG